MNLTNTQTLPTPVPRTLIADDQPDVAAALHLLLKDAGYQAEAVTSPAAALDAISQREFDLVLMDLNYARDTTSGQEGLDLITNIRELDSTLPIIVLTGWGTVELAVEAMHRGVHDFVQKPWDNRTLLKILRTQIEEGRSRRQRSTRHLHAVSVDHKLEQELADAQEIQLALLPRVLPTLNGTEIAVAWQPANVVGGDHFDVLKFGDRHAGICIADVAGKGMSAALLMSNVQAVLKSFASDTCSPGQLCARVNSVVCENIVPNRFISCFYGLLDTEKRKLSYASAGHYPPMLVRDGQCLRLTEGGPVFGVFPDGAYQQNEIELRTGDYLVLFTDGVTEARNDLDEEFGEDRLERLLIAEQKSDADGLRDKIMATLNEFSSESFADDVTLMVIRIE